MILKDILMKCVLSLVVLVINSFLFLFKQMVAQLLKISIINTKSPSNICELFFKTIRNDLLKILIKTLGKIF